MQANVVFLSLLPLFDWVEALLSYQLPSFVTPSRLSRKTQDVHILYEGLAPSLSLIANHRQRDVSAWSANDSYLEKSESKVKAENRGIPDDVSNIESLYVLDQKGRPSGLRDDTLLSKLQTPHSGRKFRQTHPSSSSKLRSILKPWRRKQRDTTTNKVNRNFLSRNNRRFTEGWYYRLTLPEYNESFVFIFSIEDAGRWVNGKKSELTLACMQMLGPGDTYLCQSDEDDTKFWGWKDAPGLGCTFDWNQEFVNSCTENGENVRDITSMRPEEWRKGCQSGFQILPFHFNGRLDGHDGTLGGVKANQGNPGRVEYDFTIQPVSGWGNYPPLNNTTAIDDNQHYRQLSTAGWLASFPVFEPHWQITMSHARASGTLNWNGTIYEFEDAPFYGEKNWGGAFPTKWYWAQCNSFDGHPDLAFTAGGGIRQLPYAFLPGKRTETLGLIGIHYNGRFFEIVPWTGEMEWSVQPWGRWEFRGRCTDKRGESQFEAEVIAVTDDDVPGVLLRAPTKDEGMVYFCRDSGFGHVTLSLWELEWNDEVKEYVRSANKEPLIDKATSAQCTVEVGGGPWWSVWNVKSNMSNTLKKIIRLPLMMRKVR